MPVKLQDPESIGRKPVAVIAIKHDRVAVVDPARAEKLFEVLFRNKVPAYLVLELGFPVPGDGAGNVTEIVKPCIDVHFENPDAALFEMTLEPFCGHQNVDLFHKLLR